MIDNLVSVLQSTYDPAISNTDRRNHFEFLQKYQNENFDLSHLPSLLNPGLSDQIKIFGLKCFENFMMYKWNDSQSEIAKEYILQLIRDFQTLNFSPEYERLSQWIISKCLMYYVKNQCCDCTHLIDGVINLATNNVYLENLVLSIFLCLSEYLPSDSSLTEKRKKYIVGYLNEEVEKIISFCLKMIKTNQKNHKVLESALCCLDSIFGWVRKSSFKSVGSDTFYTLVFSCQGIGEDYRFLTTLDNILNRKGKLEEKFVSIEILMDNKNIIQRLMELVKNNLHSFKKEYDENDFKCVKKSSEIVYNLVNLILENETIFITSYGDQLLKELIDLCMIATLFPIKILSVEILPFWTNGLKSNNNLIEKAIIKNATNLLNLLKSYSYHINVRDASNFDYHYLVNLIDEDESDSFNAKLHAETRGVIASLTKRFTQDIFLFTLDWLTQCLIFIKSNPENTESLYELKAVHFFFKHVIHSIMKSNESSLKDQVRAVIELVSADVVAKAQNCVDLILNLGPDNPQVIPTVIELISFLFPFNCDSEVRIQQCIEKIFIWYLESQKRDDSWKNVKLAGSINVVRIFRDFPFMVSVNLFESIVKFVLDQAEPSYHRSILIEALVIYICHSGFYTLDMQRELLNKFVLPIISFLQNSGLQQIYQSEETLIEFMQLNQPKPVNLINKDYPNEHARIVRDGLVLSISCLLGIIRRAYSPDEENTCLVESESNTTNAINKCPLDVSIILPILPILLTVLRTLNATWTSEKLHPDFCDIKAMSKYYRENLLLKKCTGSNSSFEPDFYFNTVRQHISNVSENIWILLGKFCKMMTGRLYSDSLWMESVTHYVFANIESIPHYKLSNMFKNFVIPFIQNCPTDRFIQFLDPVISPLIDYMFQILTERWSGVKDNLDEMKMDEECDDLDNPETRNEELADEIVALQMLTKLSRTFIDLFKIFCTISNSVEENSRITLNNSPLFNHAPASEPSTSTGTNISGGSGTSLKLGIITKVIMEKHPHALNEPRLLIWLHHLCVSLTAWRDSCCCRRISLFIPAFINQASINGVLNAQIIMFIVERSILALSTFFHCNCIEIRLNLFNLLIKMYLDYIVNSEECLTRFNSLLPSTSLDPGVFKKKMTSKITLKAKRELLENYLQPLIGVPVNQMSNQQDMFIKDLQPIVRLEWKKKNATISSKSTEAEDAIVSDLAILFGR